MKNNFIIAAKGVAMGAADVVPGVSGGTIALLTGIYPRLIDAITGLNIQSIKLLFKGQIKEFWKALDGNFILPLLVGIIFAFAILAHPIKYVIANHPIPTWSFFFGLIIAAAVLIIQHIPNKKLTNIIWIIPGIVFGFWIGSMSSIPFPNSQVAILIAGMLAICAMILPGISGSFILVLLGMYETLLTAVKELQFSVIIIFITGAILGLIIFSRIIKSILNKFYNATLFFLSGLMIGSLIKVWPWKLQHENEPVQILTNVLPSDFPNPQTLLAVCMMALAFTHASRVMPINV